MQSCKQRWIYRWLTTVLAALVVLASLLPPQRAQAAPIRQEYTYAECSRADEAAVQAEMTTLAHDVLVEGSSGLDIDALVISAWRTSSADATFNAAVDAGVARVQAERGYWERLWSGWWTDKAQEFANQVAIYTFEDPTLKAKLDEISNSIADSLVTELQAAAAQSASSALLCLQSYVGEKYSTTLFNAFQVTVSQEVNADLNLSNSETVEISPLSMHAKGLAGVGVLVATQVTRMVMETLAETFAERLAGQIAGRVLGRLGSSAIPYLGWIVGIGLLAWDLWEGNDGALPTIRDALKAEEVKNQVRDEITTAVKESITGEVDTLAASVATTLVGQWQEFCGNNGLVCKLAAENSAFRGLIDTLPVTDLTRLVQLTNFFWTQFGEPEGETQLVAAINDGTMIKLLASPPEADTILNATASPAATLAWVDLAGEQLPKVVELGLYQAIDPLIMTRLSLAALLGIDDNTIIHKLMGVPTEQLVTLLQLPTADLKQVAATATPAELNWLAEYVVTLSPKQAIAVAHELAAGKTTVATLQAPPVVAAPSDESAVSSKGTEQGAAETGQAGVAAPLIATNPVKNLPKIVTTLWTPWANNGVAVAAVLVVLLLIFAGIVLALRRQMTRPPL